MPSFLVLRVLWVTDLLNSSRTDAHYTCTTTCVRHGQTKKPIFGKVSPHVLRSTTSLILYEIIEECALPPTFQSWFTVTNLHVWLLTVRLRSLLAPHGLNHIQGLIDHFFQDVEERVRTVLQPGVLPLRLSADSTLTTPLPSSKSQHRAELGSYISPYPNSTFYTFPSPVPPPPMQEQKRERERPKDW